MPAGLRTGGTTPPGWVLSKILKQNRVHPKVTKELLTQNASVQAFVSWLLYACSPAGSGIQNPLAYALASLRENPDLGAGGAYDQLAALPAEELIRLVRDSVRRVSRKYSLTLDPSGEDAWDKTMGVSECHGILLAILLGDEHAIPTWERKVTQVILDGEELRHETVVTHTHLG